MSLIASGGFGCVYKPAYKCTNYTNATTREVSKVFKKPDELKKEEARYATMKLQLIPNSAEYYIANPQRCVVRSESYTKDTEACEDFHPSGATFDTLNYLYGGQSLAAILEKQPELIDCSLLAALGNVFTGVAKMNAQRKYHMDIKPQNIVFDGRKFRLIDFGLSKNLTVDGPENAMYRNSTYAYWPVELTYVNYGSRKDATKTAQLLQAHVSLYMRLVFEKLEGYVKVPLAAEAQKELHTYFTPLTTAEIYAKVDTWALCFTLIDIHRAMADNNPSAQALLKFIRSNMILKTKERPAADVLAERYTKTFQAQACGIPRRPLAQLTRTSSMNF